MQEYHSLTLTSICDEICLCCRFGAASFCRSGIYGMPQLVTNTMRVCTRDAPNASYDATVPVRPRYNADFTVSQEYCSSTPYQVPWMLQDQSASENPAAQFSVGAVPMWDGGSVAANSYSSTAKYPSDDYGPQILNTNPGVSAQSEQQEQGWGAGCTEGPLLECITDADCPSVLGADATVPQLLQCFRGVCVINMQRSPSCYAHRHCESSGKMCSGDGVCAESILQVENDLPAGEDVEFELYAKKCESATPQQRPVRSYDMYGASAWETVPDILRMYGMCSYRDWFEYLEFVDPSDASRSNRGVCGVRAAEKGCDPASFNALESLWWDVGAPFAETGMRTLFEMQKFRVKPHPCDRDYQHLEGLQGCAPVMDTRNSAAPGLVSHGGKALSELETVQEILDFFASGNVKRAILQIADRYGTYAQTIRRNGYVNMQGRPPFNYSYSSPLRGAGFLSRTSLMTPGGDTVFQSCNTVRQCFMDTFTFRGVERTRKVLVRGDAIQATGIASYFRDWSPDDAAKCGIFGFWISDGKGKGINRKCPGTTEETHYCCQVDMAVAPLQHLLQMYPEVLSSTLDPVCNRGPTLVHGGEGGGGGESSSSYPIFRFAHVQSIVKQIGEFYAVPKNDVTRTVKLYMGLLNDLLNEFSPPPGDIPTSSEYIQIVDCSVALYQALQSKLGCTEQQASSTSSNPMCTDYHLSASASSSSSSSGEKQAKVPSLYYFLPNTMQEFPYAWWHKCVLLRGQGIQNDQESIECVEWRQTNISQADMRSLNGLYDSEDVRSILRRIEGGVTSEAVRAASRELQATIMDAYNKFASSGVGGPGTVARADQVQKTIRENAPDPAGTAVVYGANGAMMRMGAPRDMNMRCYSQTFVAPTVSEFMQMGKSTTGRSCALNMLMWVKNENANFTRYDPRVSDPAYGKPGIHPECFVLRDKDLVTLGGSSELKAPMQYIKERLEGDGAQVSSNGAQATVFSSSPSSSLYGRGSLLVKGIEATDFFDGSFNSNAGGLLALEYVPPELQGLPPGEKDFSSVTGSVTTDMPSFERKLAETPCVTLQDMEPELPECLAEKDDPINLEESHCDAAYEKARQNIWEYAERIEAEPTMSKQYRYPEPPQMCVWDCGGMWDGYERPTHAGLDNATRDAFLGQLEAWREDCKKVAAARTHCLRKSAAGSMQDAVTETRARHYMQEVCGGRETDEERAMGIVKYVGLTGFIASEIYKAVKSNNRYSDGIDEYRKSIFEDRTSKDFTGSWYQCDAIKVRTSGSAVVDKVRSSLSYNDIVVSQDPNLIKGQEDRLKEFNRRIYQILTEEVLNISQPDCSTYNDRCIPAVRKSGQPDRSRKIDATFFQTRGGKQCFILGMVTGNIDCKFWLRDGIDADVAVVSRLNNAPLKSAVRKKYASWSVYTNDMPDPAQPHTLSYAKVARTLWVRFMDVLASNATLSAKWIRPVPLPFFEDDPTYRASFAGFNIAHKLDTERIIEERGNDCGGNNTVIQYDRCSENFNALWKSAGQSMDAHVRQRGPVVIPSKTTLIWPGLSYAHHMADAVPAWSLHARNETQIFAKWIFDQNVQCKAATIDTTVCADVSNSQVETRMQSVIPWLGGDYNPWYVLFLCRFLCVNVLVCPVVSRCHSTEKDSHGSCAFDYRARPRHHHGILQPL